MSTAAWQSIHVVKQLLHKPQEFNFFQAVRILTRYTTVQHTTDMGLAFPAHEIASVTVNDPHCTITNYFIGLWGVNGTLPTPYLEKLQQQHKLKDFRLQNFLSIFNPRLIALSYQAWEKNRLTVQDEGNSTANSRLQLMLSSLLGLSYRKHPLAHIPTTALYHYAGLLLQRPRNPTVLRDILQSYFELPIRIISAITQWHSIPVTQRTRLGTLHSLETVATLGERFCTTQRQLRVVIGPLTATQLILLLPCGKLLHAYCEFITFYVGLDYAFDIQLEIFAAEVPACALSADTPTRLGWNSWLGCQARNTNAVDPVFTVH